MKINILSFIVLLFAVSNTIAQSQISGTVTGSYSSEPLIGANIVIEGTSDGTVTDFDGNFSIQTTMDYPLSILVFIVGFETQSVTISNSNYVDILLISGNLLTNALVISTSRVVQN